MSNYNKVMLLGNVTRDIEVRYTPKGTAVADVGLAVNRFSKGDNGEKNEETTFIDVTLWGRTAEIAGQYLSKGRSVFIEGRLQLDQWDDKETGKKRSKLKVVGENLQIIGGGGERKRESTPDPGDAYRKAAAGGGNTNPAPSNIGDDEEIPF